MAWRARKERSGKKRKMGEGGTSVVLEQPRGESRRTLPPRLPSRNLSSLLFRACDIVRTHRENAGDTRSVFATEPGIKCLV